MLLNRNNRGITLNGESLSKLNELKKLHEDKSIFQHYNCLCGSNNDELIATEDRYGLECNFVICKNCGLIRMNPYYTEDFLKIFYSEYYSEIYRGGRYCSKETFEYMSNFRGGYIIDRISHIINDFKNLKVFEIGCGTGGILNAFKKIGADVYGCDYDINYTNFAKENGINVVNGGYDELTKFGKCDIMILSHIIEHLENPIDFIKGLFRLIHDNSIIYIEIPSLECINKVHKNNIIRSFQSAHIYYYLEQQFIKVLESSGLNIVKIFNENGVIGCITNRSNKESQYIGHDYNLVLMLLNLMQENYSINIKYDLLNKNLTNIINTISWWIPMRKWRDNFRNKMLNTDQTRPDQTRPDQT